MYLIIKNLIENFTKILGEIDNLGGQKHTNYDFLVFRDYDKSYFFFLAAEGGVRDMLILNYTTRNL